ncbi:hypothetical protein CPB85DRAFT_1336060 [Mucidula mucida]|nr:hypothetical protein CPB85DRAFT_1336060 [Mucidula mucida]
MMFPNLKHCEVVASLVTDGLADWLSWFRQPSLLLESFRMELNVDGTGFFCWPTNNHSIVFLEEFYWDVTPEDNVNDAAHLTNVHSILLGLRCAHLQMGIHSFVDDLEPDREQLLLDWWSSSLRTLADSNTTIHFEELTLPFNDAPHVEAVSVAWDALDKVLAHAAFSGVQQVHFEEIRGRIVITDETHPELTPRIRNAMPRLAGRGVLCFL